MEKLYNLERVKQKITENIKDISIPKELKIYLLRDVLCKVNIITSPIEVSHNFDFKKEIKDKIFRNINPEWIGGTFIGEEEIIEDVHPDERLTLDSSKENIRWIEQVYHLESWKSYTENGRKSETNEDGISKKQAKVICFYSYKGGVGRTTLASFTAAELSQEKKVVIIDADIEAPGLVFQYFGKNFTLYDCEGLIDFFLYPGEISSKEFENNFFLTHKEKNKNLYLLPASSEFNKYSKLIKEIHSSNSKTIDSISENYFQKIGRLSLVQGGMKLRDELIRLINESIEPDYILIDLRTGITDIGGLFTADDVSDLNVFVGYPDNQTLPGIDFFIKNSDLSARIDENYIRPKVLFVHSPAPRDEKGEIFEKNKEDFRRLILPFLKTELKELDEKTDPIFFDIPFQSTLRANIFSDGILKVHEANKNSNEFKSYQNFAKRVEELLMNNDSIESETETQNIEEPVQTSSTQVSIQYGDELKKEFIEGLKANPINNKDGAYSEFDLKDDHLFQMNFQYFQKDFDDLLDDNKFIIFGEKGTGKTSLKIATENEKIMNQVVRESAIMKHVYITAIGEDDLDYLNLNKTQYQTIQKREFWKYHTCEILKQYKETGDKLGKESEKKRRELLEKCIQSFAEKSIEDNEFEALLNLKEKIIIVYDYLDKTKPEHREERNTYIRELIFFWKFFLTDKITTKIFLRKDILKEIQYDDIAKIQARHSFSLNWTFEKLMAVFFKRLLSRSNSLKEIFKGILGTRIKEEEGLGIIFPDDPDSINKSINEFFKEKIGQPFARNWLERFLWIGHDSGDELHYNVRFMLSFLGNILNKVVENEDYLVVSRKARKSCPLKLNIYSTSKNSKDGILSNDKELYGKLAQNWTEKEFTRMNPDLEKPIAQLRKFTLHQPIKFKALSKNEISEKELLNLVKLKEEDIQRLSKSGFFYEEERKDEKIYNLPEVYRAYLGIKKTNALSPYLGDSSLK